MKKLFVIFVLGILLLFGIIFLKNSNIKIKDKDINEIFNNTSYYFENVITTKETPLYKIEDNNYIKVGLLSKNNIIVLDKNTDSTSKYFKLKNVNYYVNYNNIKESKEYESDDFYKNYLYFNESIIIKNNAKINVNDKINYQIDEELTLPILIKEDNLYYTIFDDKLVFINKNDIVSIKKSENNNTPIALKIAAINYHYVISKEENEHLECRQIICHQKEQFDEHMKYIKDNNFYTATMRDIEYFIDGKVNLPQKTVVITIDDGWYVRRAITILEKYDIHATLFLIGHLAPVTDYTSKNLEIHSHSWDLHDVGVCPGGQGSPIKCIDKAKALADLEKSRKSLNNTTVFCWPFYEYNDYAISLVKEAGFTMAFAGRNTKIVVGTNKYTIPRYGIINTTSLSELATIIN